ncbi:hypothetical protein OF83DRAFT_1235223 [Amylostereum chailletii]|nr:hypothetical protein OF83DRAFT_1235223 [Amylostereum chailletii]
MSQDSFLPSSNALTASLPAVLDDGQDQWSDSLHNSPEHDAIQESTTRSSQDDLALLATPKFVSANPPKVNHHPMIDTTVVGPAPVVESPMVNSFHENGSTHSLPTVQVTEPHTPGIPQTQSAHVPSFSDASFDSSHSLPRSGRSSLGTPAPPPARRLNRPRSTLEQRSPNRLSGFFSNLIHRRDAPPSPLSSAPQDRASPTPEESANASRSSSPAIPPRPSTPPPSLPPPTLQDLGLSLSVLTSNLSPSHFSTPPASGAFLAPHYLLLCHAQGLDVLPLSSPPAPQPYALIRRVSFKSVVVMEHRGVLVAIAGRRDGVRVYALDEVKKAVEWRLDVEIRRERERTRREDAKRVFTNPRDSASDEKHSDKSKGVNRPSSSSAALSSTPRSLSRKPKTPSQTSHQPVHLPPGHLPRGRPPSYRDPSPARGQNTTVSVGARRSSVTNVLGGTVSVSRRNTDAGRDVRSGDEKADLLDTSDDEAINVMTAGASGSQALDERTSSMAPSTGPSSLALGTPRPNRPVSSATLTPQQMRRNRPADLDLSTSRSGSAARSGPPSPTPTLLTLRQALFASPQARNAAAEHHGTDGEGDDDDDPEPSLNGARTPTNERITFAQALQESRLPELPPPGSRRTQQAILISQSHTIATGDDEAPPSPTSLEASSHHTRQSQDTQVSNTLSSRRRRRWSVLDGIFTNGGTPPSSRPTSPPTSPVTQRTPSLPRARTPTATRERQPQLPLTRSHSTTFRSVSAPRPTPTTRPSTAQGSTSMPQAGSAEVPPVPPPPHSRFLSRLIGSAFASRRSEDHGDSDPQPDSDTVRKSASSAAPPAPAPKLEYVKLPGTKGALLIKAVETSKKSFLAILCGDNGEKVELFAGTYRTALGLSRTFILPDSPRSLELQLQGDDLVEVFLVFAQNVFGLEPATVRVREVRIGRAERRAARRRARELRGAEDAPGAEPDSAVPVDEATIVTVSVGVAPASSTSVAGDSAIAEAATSTTTPGRSTTPADPPPATSVTTPAIAHTDELLALAAAQMGPYSTFQQLQFSPKFPLAAIADEYIIPPTYPEFLQYRAEHEPDVNGGNNVDLSQVQFSPPGLPLPPIVPPTKWYYRDPKGVVHGPWKSGLMQAWYRDGLLPPDLPVRREDDTDYTLLKDLRQQSVDPTQPFGPSPAPRSFAVDTSTPIPTDAAKPLLDPLSLLSQSRIFGPPALFFSTRGGHSTVIVDGRGRSVLKGRFTWTRDDEDDDAPPAQIGRLGDVKRLEAFDVQDRSVLVAMRQGGFEAVDFRDALLKPADASRNVLPQFITTHSQVNRRQPFTWKIGMPVSTSPSSATSTSLVPLKSHARLLHTPVKKHSTGPGKSAGRSEFGAGDGDSEHTRDEVIFLGRRDDNIYICERNGGAFRILRLCPTASVSF